MEQTTSSGNGQQSRRVFCRGYVFLTRLGARRPSFTVATRPQCFSASQTRIDPGLVQQTLDALPAHKMTPFNGPVPPSSLLDRIAKGVLDAKGPAEWPHSLRQTRAKIIELCRLRATEDTASDTIAEESTDADVLQQTTNRVPKRPLYRQSSMDFMQSAKIDPKENDSIARYVPVCC